MGILITRAILLVILCAVGIAIIAVIVSKKLKADNSMNFNKTELKEYIKQLVSEKSLLMIPILIVVMAIASHPFEGKFLRFDTPEESLNYGIARTMLNKNYMAESNNCYFVLSSEDSYPNSSGKCYIISKYGDKVGLVNNKAEFNVIGVYSDFRKSSINLNCYGVYDKKSKSSCYFIWYSNFKERANEHTVLVNNKKADCISYVLDEADTSNANAVYSCIVDGKFKENIVVTIDGEELKIKSMEQFAEDSVSKSVSSGF